MVNFYRRFLPVSPPRCSRSPTRSRGPQDAGVAAGRHLRSGQGGPGGRGTTGAPSPERRALSRHRRLGHTRRRRASTAYRGEMAAAGVLLQEVVGGGHQVLHLRQGAAGRFQRGQTFQILTGGATVPPTDRPQAARHIPVPHNAAVVGPPQQRNSPSSPNSHQTSDTHQARRTR
jgi:hypothetical protein